MPKLVLMLCVAWLLSGCGKTMGCYNGTITMMTSEDTYHGEGVVLSNGMTVERCLQIRQELGQIP